MKTSTKIINMLDVYFTLLSLERGWKNDVYMSIQLKGGDCISFATKDEVTRCREAYERDLRGISQLANSHRVDDIVSRG